MVPTRAPPSQSLRSLWREFRLKARRPPSSPMQHLPSQFCPFSLTFQSDLLRTPPPPKIPTFVSDALPPTLDGRAASLTPAKPLREAELRPLHTRNSPSNLTRTSLPFSYIRRKYAVRALRFSLHCLFLSSGRVIFHARSSWKPC